MRRTMFLLLLATSLHALPTRVDITRLQGKITIDGDLSDEAWKSARRVEQFVEYFTGDNTAPPAKTVGYIAYDAEAVYVAFVAEDPRPREIRAPLVDRDKVQGDQDYVAILIDTLNDHRSGVNFRVNPHGVQTDSIVNDATGEEDFSPDFFYQAVARRTPDGWAAEMRIPLSSLRYPNTDPQTWGVILMRNYPRGFRYIMSNTPIPKNSGCFLCHSAALTGLENLPTGSHFTLAPYSTASTGTDKFQNDLGLDLKWNPNTRITVDATLNPDFSQIEADVPQLAVNSRFALSYPEKRTFFLEGVDLLATPMQVVYTRTITSPAWGMRATGQVGSSAYTVLVAEDRGGGLKIIPGPYGSQFLPDDDRSRVLIARLRHSIGGSFLGLLASARESKGGGHNRLIGPDYLWKMSEKDRLVGQVLLSDTDGESGYAARTYYTHDAKRWDAFAVARVVSPRFRADNGFMPMANVEQGYAEGGGRFYPKKGITYFRPYFGVAYAREAVTNDLIWRQLHPGFYFQGKWGSEGWITYRAADRERVQRRVLDYSFTEFSLRAAPLRWLPAVKLEGSFGEKPDYATGRLGEGGSLSLSSSIRPTDHLELQFAKSREWLGGVFSADIDWVKATYTISARSLVRVIGQQSAIDRSGAPLERATSLSALYGYKVNWQTVFFVGYGDAQEKKSVFMKVAYAFQR